jgi:uncharacterized protein
VKIDLTTNEREPVAFDEALELDAERLDTDRVVGSVAVRIEGTVRPVAGRFVVAGRANARATLSCSRCLEPVEWLMETAFEVELAHADSAPLDAELALDEDEMDVVFLDDSILDLEELAAEQVLLELPIRVLCDDNCAGLCPRCGANRNIDGACRCEPEPDPRWAALGELTKFGPDN